MKFLRLILPWLLIVAIILTALYLPDMGPENYKDFDTLFANERKRQGIAGYEIAIIKNGEIVFNKAYGFDGQRKTLEPSTPLYIGPASEILTGTLLCQFVNQKRYRSTCLLPNSYQSSHRSRQGGQGPPRWICR